MGVNNSKTGQSKHPFLSQDEYSHLETLFKTTCGEHEGCTEKDLSALWEGQVDEHLLKLIMNYFFKNQEKIDLETFIRPYTNVVLGSTDEKMSVLLAVLTEDNNKDDIPTKNVIDYVHSIVSSYMITLSTAKDKAFLSWKSEKFELSDSELKLFTKFLCQDFSQDSKIVNLEKLEEWVASWSRLSAIESSVFRSLYKVAAHGGEEGKGETLIPRCVGLPKGTSFPSILDVSNIACLNSSLPKELRDQWRFLFSTAIHGESFSKLLGHITNKGASILIIQDKGGHVFGGFAPESWALGPNFIGKGTSFLFSLRPVVHVYYPTDYNTHYQYLNVQQQTLPNGLGMGGQFGYFGLWLDAEFGHGHCSETCTTYRDYKMLSATKEFEVNHVEVWGVGAEPKKDEDEEGKRSVLDADVAVQAMLEMVGKTRLSDGLREPVEED